MRTLFHMSGLMVYEQKKVEKGKKVFQPAFGCAQHPKAELNMPHVDI